MRKERRSGRRSFVNGERGKSEREGVAIVAGRAWNLIFTMWGSVIAPAFTTAGGHFNPTSAHHGVKNSQEPHAHLGDLENLKVGADGKAERDVTILGATLARGAEFIVP